MKLRFFLILALISIPLVAAGSNNVGQTYRVDKGDQFDVYVLNEEDLSITAKVNDEGTIFYPLLGEVPVVGLTTDEIEAVITRKLKGPYLVKPVVSVTMVTYREFFIGGAVNNPGWYEYEPGMTFQEAVDLAGGFSDLASRRKIYVQDPKAPTQERTKVTLDHLISPDDSLFIGESFF